jgi:hypothetical protein
MKDFVLIDNCTHHLVSTVYIYYTTRWHPFFPLQTARALNTMTYYALASFMSQMVASKPGFSSNMTIICDNARVISPYMAVTMQSRPAYLRSQSIPELSPTKKSRWQILTSNEPSEQKPNTGSTTPRPSILRSQSSRPDFASKFSRCQSLTHSERAKERRSLSLFKMPRRKESVLSYFPKQLDADDESPRLRLRPAKSKAGTSLLLGCESSRLLAPRLSLAALSA